MIAEVAVLVAAEPLAAGPIPAPQFGNFPDFGWPPVERFPRPILAPEGRLDPHGLRRVTLTTAGQVRYEQSRGMPRLTGLPVPVPQFPAIKTPARERMNGPGPGQPTGLTLTHSSSGALCMTCVDNIPSDPDLRGAP